MPELQCPSPPPIVPRPTALDVRPRTRRTQLNWQTVIIGLLVAGILVLCIYLAVTHLPAGSLRIKPTPADFPTEKELAIYLGRKLRAQHVEAGFLRQTGAINWAGDGYFVRFEQTEPSATFMETLQGAQRNQPLFVTPCRTAPKPGYKAGVVFGPYLIIGSFERTDQVAKLLGVPTLADQSNLLRDNPEPIKTEPFPAENRSFPLPVAPSPHFDQR